MRFLQNTIRTETSPFMINDKNGARICNEIPARKRTRNFGSIDGDRPAAMRTEAKMEKMTDEMLTDIDKETVAWRDNYGQL